MGIPEQELDDYIDNLIALTEKGSVQWKAVNPTTFIWDRIDARGGGRLSLQRLERNLRTAAGIVKRTSYILQASELSPLGASSQPRISIDSSDNPKTHAKLKSLFDLIAEGISRKDLEFLKNLLPRS
jgi:hypothetical protein